MLSTFFLLFNYHHNAVDNPTKHYSMSVRAHELEHLICRNTSAKALDQPAFDGTNPIRSVADPLLFDFADF